MPEPRDHADHRPAIESVLRQIPGFRGYLEKEYRRESDELQRRWLADRLQRSKRAADEVSRRLVESAEVDLLPQIDRLRSRLDRLIGRIRGAMQGYSGFFDLVQVDEHLLDQVYEHDMALMEQVEALAKAVEELPGQPDHVPSALPDLMRRVDDVEGQWDLREDMLKGLA